MRFNKYKNWLAGLATSALLLGSAPSASADEMRSAVPSNQVTLERADLESWLDGFLPYALERGEIAGAVIAVVKNGEVLLKKGYGHADVAAGRPMDPDVTLMRIGSVSKLFTWTAVMQLVEQGKLDLDKDINTYLDFKVPEAFGKPVTMRQLMAHRGGFEEGLKMVLMTDPTRLISTEEYLKEHPRPRIFSPGEIPAYSNYGTALAGYIVQRISGEPYETYIEQHILTPLRMSRSTFRQPLPEDLAKDLSKGYMKASAEPRPFELVVTAPAGSGTATASDMAQFMLAYLQEGRVGEGQILRPETVREMQSGRGGFDAPNGFSRLSYGFFDQHTNGRHVIGHGGDTVVFHSDFHLLLDEGVGIFFSFNSRGAEDSNYQIRSELFEKFMDRYFPDHTSTELLPAIDTAGKDALSIAGRYESSRRIETGFLSLFYMLGQTVIAPNPDGTIAMPSPITGKLGTFRETATNLWTEVGGDGRLAFTTVDGRPAVIDSHDPTSILQAVPLSRSAGWNLPAFSAAVIIVVLTIVLWPVNALVRRHYRSPLVLNGRDRWVYLLPRIGAVIALVYLLGWFALLQPILVNQLDVYNDSLDPQMRLLQFAGLILIVVTGAVMWSAWQTIRKPVGIAAKIGRVLVALALLDLVWVGLAFKMISVNLDY